MDTFPKELADGSLALDWAKVARDVAVIHIGPRAVAAMDSLPLTRGQKRYAPSSWSVPTSVWLSWSFDRSTEITPVAGAGGGRQKDVRPES